MFRKESLPNVGTSLGIERIIDLMDILQLYPPNIVGTVVEALVTVFNAESRPAAAKLAADLRAGGVRTELFMQDRALGKQFEYANKKGIPLVATQGSEEIASGTVKLKRLSDGTELTVDRNAVAEKIIAMLR
jgi:histidyl-tRNA synthetase